MSRVRVYELAKELGITSKKLIEVLNGLDIEVKNHMSTLDKDVADKILNLLISGESKKDENIKNENIDIAIPQPKKKKADLKKIHGKDKPSKKNEIKEGYKARKAARIIKERDNDKKQQKKIIFEGRVTVAELASKLEIEPTEIIKKLFDFGIVVNINQEIDIDFVDLIAEDYDVKISLIKDPMEEDLFEEKIDFSTEIIRPPVATVLGHVDHGKTSLLDAIRQENVTAQEAGGITQHIGAYQVEISGKKIVFLDTPGHEAFTAMRARGAQVTDIAILVVAADDGVMPQTVEAVNHVKAAGVPIIVAINKIDKHDANPDRVKQQLAELGLIPEEWGGDTITVNISALKKHGLDNLLEMILLVSELLELKANPGQMAKGIVVEAKLDRARGPIATVLIQNGTLRVGDPVICGPIFGKVRAMVNDRGKRIKEATPSIPVEILGLSDMPHVGDILRTVSNEKNARQIAEKRLEKLRQANLRKKQKVSLDDLCKQIQGGEIKELNLIIKGDVQGSVEAIQDALQKLSSDEVHLQIIHSGVGAITESDVMLASASNAIIIGFNVRPTSSVRRMAELENVDLRLYRVIYELVEDVQSAIKGMLAPSYEEVIVGQAEVRQLFKISKVGTIAGSYVQEGKISRNCLIRIIRNSRVIHEGEISSLKRFKDDAKEVMNGFECGIMLENFNDLEEGDILECFTFEEVKV